jgi:hypothetical protein
MVSYKPRVGQRKIPVAASRTADHGGWTGPRADTVSSAAIKKQMNMPFDLLLGAQDLRHLAGDEQMSLIHSMLMSVDGYVEDEHGRFDWAAPDEEVHSYINQLESSVGTYLYGRRMYETMIYWETAHSVPDQPQFVLDWARHWQATEKIVYSRTLAEPRSRRTRIERDSIPT